MAKEIETDVCVIGAGSAGLSVAAGASQLGARCVLVEMARMGGDCLNYGCVPSKALIAAAHHAEAIRRAGAFGIEAGAPRVDFSALRDHIRSVIAEIAPHDSQARFEGLGVTVLRERAQFRGPDRLEAGAHVIRARRFVIATGSKPLIPPIPGIAGVPYLTNETIFDLDRRPEILAVLGGGPIGCELGQAMARLGCTVAIVELGSLLPREDPEAVAIVRNALRAEGVGLHEGARLSRVEAVGGRLDLALETKEGPRHLAASHLLIAAGRIPAIDGLGLEAAGVEVGKTGIRVDRHLRTTNRRIYAIGDVTGLSPFTHMAGHHAGIVIQHMLFRLPAKVESRAVPRVTYTAPELAQVGLSEAEGRAQGLTVGILRAGFAENDRARTERDRHGFVKLVTGRRGKILGATIVGAQAGDLIAPFILAIKRGLGAGALAGLIQPYPTRSEAGKRAASSFFLSRLFSPRTKALVRFLMRFG